MFHSKPTWESAAARFAHLLLWSLVVALPVSCSSNDPPVDREIYAKAKAVYEDATRTDEELFTTRGMGRGPRTFLFDRTQGAQLEHSRRIADVHSYREIELRRDFTPKELELIVAVSAYLSTLHHCWRLYVDRAGNWEQCRRELKDKKAELDGFLAAHNPEGAS